jgi:hypothetical protein
MVCCAGFGDAGFRSGHSRVGPTTPKLKAYLLPVLHLNASVERRFRDRAWESPL